MTFFQFASNNVRRNARAYAAYFMSSTFAILMFFLYATLASHPDLLNKGYVDHRVIEGMQVAEYIIFIFSFFSILYSMGSFLKGRNREFGILIMLGITSRQLIWMVFLENMLLGVGAIIVGLLIGLLGSKLFLLLGSVILDIPSLPFYIPEQALLITGVAFIVLFLLISIATTVFTRNTTVLTLLKGNQRPKREPRASLPLALLSAVLLIAGYAWALNFYGADEPLPIQPILIIAMVAVGTYLLYAQLSVFFIHMLKRRRNYYWRGTHMLWLSELAYSMRDNARLFFVIAMMLSIAFTATGTVAILDAQQQSPGAYPSAFTLGFDRSSSKLIQPSKQAMTQAFNTNHLAYTTVQVPFIIMHANDKHPSRALLSETNYNRLAAAVQMPRLTVQPGEVVDPNPDHEIVPNDTIPGGQGQLHIVGSTRPMVVNPFSFNSLSPLVITDQEYHDQSMHTQEGLYISYNVPQWQETTALSSALEQQIYSLRDDDPQDSVSFSSHALAYLEGYQLPNIILFIGLFTAIIFLIASSSFLYFRLYTIMTANKEQYRALSKIGFTEPEMRTSITIQVAILFFSPFLMAVISTMFAMLTLKNNMHADFQVLLPTIGTIGIFLGIQIVYFLIIRVQYIHQLKQVLV